MIDIYEELHRLIRAFEDRGLGYALCGGLAMAVHGRPRATMDIDLIVVERDIDAALTTARSLGYCMPGAAMPAAQGRLRIQRVVLVDEAGKDLLPLDLMTGDAALSGVW